MRSIIAHPRTATLATVFLCVVLMSQPAVADELPQPLLVNSQGQVVSSTCARAAQQNHDRCCREAVDFSQPLPQLVPHPLLAPWQLDFRPSGIVLMIFVDTEGDIHEPRHPAVQFTAPYGPQPLVFPVDEAEAFFVHEIADAGRRLHRPHAVLINDTHLFPELSAPCEPAAHRRPVSKRAACCDEPCGASASCEADCSANDRRATLHGDRVTIFDPQVNVCGDDVCGDRSRRDDACRDVPRCCDEGASVAERLPAPRSPSLPSLSDEPATVILELMEKLGGSVVDRPLFRAAGETDCSPCAEVVQQLQQRRLREALVEYIRTLDAVSVDQPQTGRLMLGVGVNSDAGLAGSIVLDEHDVDHRSGQHVPVRHVEIEQIEAPDPLPPRVSSAVVVGQLRESAARLEETANELERHNLYLQADAVRELAQRLRYDARGYDAVPSPHDPIVPAPSLHPGSRPPERQLDELRRALEEAAAVLDHLDRSGRHR